MPKDDYFHPSTQAACFRVRELDKAGSIGTHTGKSPPRRGHDVVTLDKFSPARRDAGMVGRCTHSAMSTIWSKGSCA
jgi:hypothetical protein